MRLRPPLLAATAACALLLTPIPPATAADQPQRPVDIGFLYQQPPLDGVSMAFAYDRMTGITPDFRPYAERSAAANAATAFDRPAVIERETARYQAAFQSLDLAKIYDVRLNAEIKQYDAASGGYALPLSEDSFIRVTDPATFKAYGLQFRNPGDVSFVPVGDPAAARAFAAKNRLNMQGPIAGYGTLQMAFRLVEAPPALDSNEPPMVRADIIAARLLSNTGAVIHDFGLTPAARGAPSWSGTEVPGQTALKAADVQGLRLGMTQAEAEAIASKGWTTKRGSQQVGQELWLNDLQAPRSAGALQGGDWAVCGDLTNGVPPSMGLMTGASPPTYKDCIGYGFARVGASNGPYGDRVGQVAAQQFLAGGDATTLRRALEEKYGKPTYVRGGGSDLVWVGRDPAKPDGESVIIEAKLGTETGQAAGNRVVLQVSLAPYVDPQRPKPVVAQPAVTGGPRL